MLTGSNNSELRDHGFHQFHCPDTLATKIAVAKEDALRAGVLDILDHLRGWPNAVATSKVQPLRAEVTLHRTPARRHQRVGFERPIFVKVQHLPPRQRQARKTRHLRSVVYLLQATTAGILQHASPDRFALANSNGVAMLGRFSCVEPDVWPAHDHGD